MGDVICDNPWWLNVLDGERPSPHAVSFDLDWTCCRIAPAAVVLLHDQRLVLREALDNSRSTALRRGDRSFSGMVFTSGYLSRRKATAKCCAPSLGKSGAESERCGKQVLEASHCAIQAASSSRNEAPAFRLS